MNICLWSIWISFFSSGWIFNVCIWTILRMFEQNAHKSLFHYLAKLNLSEFLLSIWLSCLALQSFQSFSLLFLCPFVLFFFPILLLNISQNQGDHCYKCTCKSGRDVKCLWESCRHIILIFDVHIYVCEAVCVATLCLKSFYFAFGFNLVLGCWCGYQKVRLHGGVKL